MQKASSRANKTGWPKMRTNKLEFYCEQRRWQTNYQGQWRWRLVAKNGRIVAASSESFSSLQAAKGNAYLTFDILGDIAAGCSDNKIFVDDKEVDLWFQDFQHN